MDRIRLLRNPIREYAWGSRTALAELLGQPSPSARPQAELWMGAHPAAASEVRCDSKWVPLGDWIRRDPEAVLGPEVARRFAGEIPFLLKVLAAARPLSLQAHPAAARARAGFERENAAGIALNAPQRCYRDPSPKPELLCALTPFAALCGFRPIDDIVANVDALRVRRLAGLIRPLRRERSRENLRGFYRGLMELAASESAEAVAEAVEAADRGYGDPAVRDWLRELAEGHPGDPGALSPLFINLLELRPGEALFLPAGELHAYLRGTAVEIMANSDNVLRGGLTEKHVDVAELLASLSFESGRPEVLMPRVVGPVESVYETPAREFVLTVLRPRPDAAFESAPTRSIEILLCVEGEAAVEDVVRDGATPLPRGSAVLVPAASAGYRLRGDATVFRAGVPSAAESGAGSR
jgi:mannose-6-phosphate isomerase